MTYRLNQLSLPNHCSQAVNLSNSIKDIIYPLNLLPSHKFNFDTHVTPRCHCTWNTIKNHETMRFHVEIDMATRSEPIKSFSIKLAGHTAKDNNSQRKTTSITAYLERTNSVGFLRKLPTTFSYFFHFKFDSSSCQLNRLNITKHHLPFVRREILCGFLQILHSGGHATSV